MPIYALGRLRPTLPPAGQYWIAPTAVLIGDVRLERGASVWFGAILRGDNAPIVIGEDSNVQDSCVLHTDPDEAVILGRGVTVGHAAIMHGCQVGAGSLIGMGATLLNGVTVGRNCLIGARSLITENKAIPDDSLVFGSPAKVAGTVTEDRRRALARSAEIYTEKWRRYAAELAPVEAHGTPVPGPEPK